MATINGIQGKGHAIARLTAGQLRDRAGTLEMSNADVARLIVLDDAGVELVYTGPVVVDGVRRVETFPVLVRISMSGDTPAIVHFTQSGPPRGGA